MTAFQFSSPTFHVRHALAATSAALLIGAPTVLAVPANPAPLVAAPPNLVATLDAAGGVTEVVSVFSLTNTPAKKRGRGKSVALKIDGKTATVKRTSRDGTGWIGRLTGDDAATLVPGTTYSLKLTVCSSKKCSTWRFEEQLQTTY